MDSADQVDADSGADLIEVVDSGLKPYMKGVHHGISFGVVVENTSDQVLKDAKLKVTFRDSDGTDLLAQLAQDNDVDTDELDQWKSVKIPSLAPGAETGFGGHTDIWMSTLYTDEGQLRPDRVDYDEVSIEIDMVSGELWPEDNDKYQFVDISATDVTTFDGVKQKTYLDDTPVTSQSVEYVADLDACGKTANLGSSGVLYDADGAIISGYTKPQPKGQIPFSPDSDVAYGDSDAWGPMDEDFTVDVYPYAAPLKVNLKG